MFSECFNAILGKLITVEDITPLPDTICLSVSTKLSITLEPSSKYATSVL